MPFYSYHCVRCEKDFELLVGMSEKPACPNCNSKRLERLVSRVAIPGKGRTIVKVGGRALQAKRRAKATATPVKKVKAAPAKKAKKRPADKRTSRR